MTPKMTGTKPGQKDPAKVPGIRFRGEPRYHLNPWRLRLYHNKKETCSFHRTFEEALAAKNRAKRLVRKEGTRALGYDRAAQLEYEEAKRILGPGVDLVQLARETAARAVAGTVSITLSEAVKDYEQGKIQLGRSRKHTQDIRQRLACFSAHFSNRNVDTIRTGEVLKFILGLAGGGRKKWNFYGTVASFFHHAVRVNWCPVSPCDKIDLKADLPQKRKGRVEILTPAQGAAIMRQIEVSESLYIAWACLQYFIGIRDAEAERFRGEWIQLKKRRVVVPGWFLDGDDESAVEEGVSKTRDDWILDKVPPAFWAWVERYPEAFSEGPIPYPSARAWERARDVVFPPGDKSDAAGSASGKPARTRWPKNGFRHSFATYHLSWLRSADETSFLLRHRDSKKLWDSYFAYFVPEATGRRYLALKPLPRLQSARSVED
jgi:hypothetical protein